MALSLSAVSFSVAVGETISANVARTGSTVGDLVVNLSQSPSGRFSIPASTTILDGQSVANFNVEGIAYGQGTITATAGADSDTLALTVKLPGLGGEVFWIAPTLDDEGAGSSTAFDLSGNGRNATLTDMVPASDWVTDTANSGLRAINFDGTDDQLMFGSTAFGANTAQLSLAAWIRRPTAGTLGPFVGLGNGGTTNRIEIQPWSDNFLYVTFTSSIYGWISLDQAWNHYAVLYDGSASGNANRLRVFRNGTAQTVSFAGTIPATVGTAALTPRIGRSHAGNFGAGRFDDARAWSRLITADEISHLAGSRNRPGPAPTGPSLALIHHLRQMAGNAA